MQFRFAMILIYVFSWRLQGLNQQFGLVTYCLGLLTAFQAELDNSTLRTKLGGDSLWKYNDVRCRDLGLLSSLHLWGTGIYGPAVVWLKCKAPVKRQVYQGNCGQSMFGIHGMSLGVSIYNLEGILREGLIKWWSDTLLGWNARPPISFGHTS